MNTAIGKCDIELYDIYTCTCMQHLVKEIQYLVFKWLFLSLKVNPTLPSSLPLTYYYNYGY